jgi:hypothetical protein
MVESETVGSIAHEATISRDGRTMLILDAIGDSDSFFRCYVPSLKPDVPACSSCVNKHQDCVLDQDVLGCISCLIGEQRCSLVTPYLEWILQTRAEDSPEEAARFVSHFQRLERTSRPQSDQWHGELFLSTIHDYLSDASKVIDEIEKRVKAGPGQASLDALNVWRHLHLRMELGMSISSST